MPMSGGGKSHCQNGDGQWPPPPAVASAQAQVVNSNSTLNKKHWTYCFGANFASQLKLTELPLIHYSLLPFVGICLNAIREWPPLSHRLL